MAQKETSVWLDRNYALDFKTFPPQPLPIPSVFDYQTTRGTVADANGNLLFFSDGVHCYDRRGFIMPNGKGIEVEWSTTILPYIIAPVPGSVTKYYLFFVRTPKSSTVADFDRSLRYWIIDLTANGGYGDVINKNVILENAGDEYALMRTPEDKDGFWIITVENNLRDKLLAFRVSSNGVAPEPIGTPVEPGIESAFWKASPNGSYLAIRISTQNSRPLAILKFNSSTGQFNRFRVLDRTIVGQISLGIFATAPEFSSDSRMIYVMKDSLYSPALNLIQTAKTLLCYDLNALTQEQFEASGKIVHAYPQSLIPTPTGMQLTPQGKIVVGDASRIQYFGVINHPKACAVENKDFQLHGIPLPNPYYLTPPFFPSWYFHEPDNLPLEIVGKDTLVCPSATIKVGRKPVPGYAYQWEPTDGLSDLNSSNPEFITPRNISEEPDTTELFVTVTDEHGCAHPGSLNVATRPVDQLNIGGSKSVCPGVKGVKYWIREDGAQTNINWSINGGSLASVLSSDTVLVDWGVANTTASVHVESTNANDCLNETHPFPVRIFKQLETETPNGDTALQCDDFTEQYKIIETNGSHYDWEVENGQLIQGEGTSEVTIIWDQNSLSGKVWINESVNTELETCFGTSDTLVVINPKQMLSQNLRFYNLSGTTDSEQTLEIEYELRLRDFYKMNIQVQRRDERGEWVSIGFAPSSQQKTELEGEPLNQGVFYYRLLAFNICGDSAISQSLRNIFLQETNSGEQNIISLSWNSFDGWQSGVKDYRVYRKLDNQNEFTERGISNSTSFPAEKNTDGFKHVLYVTASSLDGKYSSISNRLTVEFEHPLIIPNIITPNNDQKNDTWEPYPLELYPEMKVEIFNRWGRSIYMTNSYDGGWDGGDLPDGIYFYFITTPKKQFKGFIEITR